MGNNTIKTELPENYEELKRQLIVLQAGNRVTMQ